MRAAEDERIDCRRRASAGDIAAGSVGDFAFEPAFLDQRDEQRAGAGDDADFGVQLSDGALVGAALDRGAGADDADVAVARGGGGGLRAGSDDAGDADREVFFEDGQREGGGGVAGDDDGLGVSLEKKRGDLQAVTLHRGGAFSAVGDAGGVAEILDRFVRQAACARR